MKSAGSRRIWQFDKRGAVFAALLVWVAVVIMVIPQGLDYQGINGMPSSSDALSRFTWLFLLGSSFLMLAIHFARTKALGGWLNPFLLAFLALAAASILWSMEPMISARRALRAATIVATCISFTLVGWHPRRFQDVVRPLMTALILSSLLFYVLDPQDALHHSTQAELSEALHGITIGKNVLGSFASISMVLWLHAWLAKETSTFAAVCGGAMGLITLILTRSATSLVSTVFAVMFMLILLKAPGSLRRYMPFLVGGFATLVLIYALAVLRLVPGMDIFLQPIVLFTGKDLTFTGRTAIWEILNEHIRQRPWFGGGYGAYWIGANPVSASYEMVTRLFFYPSEGHNGYLDVINDLGLAGGLCLLGYFASYLRQALQLMRFDRYQGALYLTLLFRAFMADMSESHWFSALSVDFILMTLATTALARGLLQTRLDNSAPTHALKQTRPVRPAMRRPLGRLRRRAPM